ncbi:MAG: Flp pilus assembly protein CpaB [Actinobacteria bacterium HGW-Actinobacteria-7]|nr:MAG: Flp pilus assembly protein CpaB [Actinobacteria bacterium HGW-Actinobacteria-7]
MRSRLLIVLVALVLAGVAATLALRYVSSARTEVASGSKPVEILVAQEDIPRGLSSDELLSKEMVVLQEVPQRFVAAGAISSPRAIEGQVLNTPLSRGEQLTTARFATPSAAGLAYSIPKEYVAIAIPVDDVKGISGLVKPGDHIAVYATFAPGPNGEENLTKLLLADAKVLAVGETLSADSTDEQPAEKGSAGIGGASRQEDAAPHTMTLSVSPKDAAKLVFAEETGKVWVTLLPATAEESPAAPAQTIRTVFK